MNERQAIQSIMEGTTNADQKNSPETKKLLADVKKIVDVKGATPYITSGNQVRIDVANATVFLKTDTLKKLAQRKIWVFHHGKEVGFSVGPE